MDIGCSSFSWQTADGRHLLGRTYDQFGDLAANQVIAVPAGLPCPAGLKGEEDAAPARYGYTGMAVLGFGEPILVDGVNTAGLMGALLHYPGYAVYHPAAPGRTAVHPGRLVAWLLARCANVEEAVEALASVALVDDLTQGSPLAAHYILSDRTGEAVILEPDRDGLSVHRQTIGVLTNSPDYLWHRTNLRAYVGVTNLPKAPPDHRRSPDRGVRGAAGRRLRPAGGLFLPLPVRAGRLYEGVRRPRGGRGGRGIPDAPGLRPGGYPGGAGQGRPGLPGVRADPLHLRHVRRERRLLLHPRLEPAGIGGAAGGERRQHPIFFPGDSPGHRLQELRRIRK